MDGLFAVLVMLANEASDKLALWYAGRIVNGEDLREAAIRFMVKEYNLLDEDEAAVTWEDFKEVLTVVLAHYMYSDNNEPDIDSMVHVIKDLEAHPSLRPMQLQARLIATIRTVRTLSAEDAKKLWEDHRE